MRIFLRAKARAPLSSSVEGTANEHPGQGTACRRFFFAVCELAVSPGLFALTAQDRRSDERGVTKRARALLPRFRPALGQVSNHPTALLVILETGEQKGREPLWFPAWSQQSEFIRGPF